MKHSPTEPPANHPAASDVWFDLHGWRWHAMAAACFMLIAAFFLLDLYTSVGIADAIAYLAVVLLSIRLFSTRFTLGIAVFSSLATVAGLLYSPGDDSSMLFAWTNRFLCLCAIWATALLGLLLIREIKRRRAAQQNIHAANVRLEQRVAEKTWLLTLMRDVAIHAVEADNVDLAIQYVLQRVGRHHLWSYGQAYLPTEDGRLRLSDGWFQSQPHQYERLRERVQSMALSPGRGLAGRAFQSGRPETTADPIDDLRGRGVDVPTDLSFQSATAIPIPVEDKIIAVLEFYSDQPLGESDTTPGLVSNIGEQLGRLLERRIVESQLRESEERFRLMVDSVEDFMIVELDPQGRVNSWNRGAERITGYTAADVMGQHVSMFYTDNARDLGVPEHILAHAATRGRYADEGWRVRKDGSRFWCNVVMTALRDEHHNLRGYLKITRDMTERKRLEKQIVDLTMQEQQRIGRELHDSFGQQVTGIALLAANLKRMLEARDAPEAERAASLVEVIEDARAEVRALTKGLMPVEVDANGLQSALQELVEQTESTYNLDCEFRCSSPVNVENNTTATHLFKIAKEAIHNVVKHADATKLTVSLSEKGNVVTLSVRDNGTGIAGDPQKIDGNGLHIMRYRAGLIDATLNIRNGNRGGTTITCAVQREAKPLPETAVTS